jgi:hypothetical protein
VDRVINAAKELDSAFAREALFHAFRRALPLKEKAKRYMEEQQRALGYEKLGIHQGHPLFAVREALRKRVESARVASEAETLMLWGTRAKAGASFYGDMATLIRGLVAAERELGRLSGPDIVDIAKAWAAACGVTHPTVLNAIPKLVDDVLLDIRPAELDVHIDVDAVELSRQLANGDAHLAFLLCRCFMRIAAYQRDGFLRWRSTWLRGGGANEDAIPGASTRSQELTAILWGRVMKKTVGHSAGKKAATGKVLVTIRRGNMGVVQVADHLGVELDKKGQAKR